MPDPKILAARFLSSRDVASGDGRAEAPLDRIFVRDLTLQCDIGVYDHEIGAPQRVRFGVEVDVTPNPLPVEDDVARVMSYDDIVQGIKAVLATRRFNLVETLAEEIAAMCLANSRAMRVRVRIEKLDFEPEAVGVEIERRRPPVEAANIYPLPRAAPVKSD